MEYRYNRILLRILLCLWLGGTAGCTGDPDGGAADGDYLAVRITTRIGGGMASPTAAGFSDALLGTIDVLSFDENGKFLYRAAASVIDDNGKYFEVWLKKNRSEQTQTLVVLANLRDEIEAFPLTAGQTTKTELQQGLVFTFTHLADLTDPEPDAAKVFGQERLLPMWGESEPLFLWADEQNIGTIYLMRAVAGVTVTVELEDDPAQKDFKLVTAVIYNTPSHGLAIPDPVNIAEDVDNLNNYYLKAVEPTVPATIYGKAYYTDPDEGFVNTIYIGEKKNSGAGTEDFDTWLVIAGKYDGGEPTWYRLPFKDVKGDYHDILRNHDYKFKITKVTGPGSGSEEIPDDKNIEIDMSIEVKGWSTVNVDPIDDVVLNVSAVKASINERNMARIWFWTNRKREDISVEPATPADAIFTGLTDGSQSNLVFDPATGQGYIDIMTDPESGAADGSYTLMLNAGGLKRSIEVDVKIVGYPLMEYYDYVGAFWRANEVGERVIVIPNNDEKEWTASVEYSTETGTQTGWVKIAAGKSPDPNYWTEDPGDAEDFPVEKDQGTIGGNEHIFFRLGCTGPNTGAAPRYARVKIVWDGDDDPDKNHYLYLRQGEQDDYLMRPTDPAADNSLSPVNGQYRPLSTKYTVYNLTSEEYLNGTKTGGTTIDTHSQLGGSGPYTDENRTYSAFTQYPTQTGGFVTIHARDFLRYILHPVNPYLQTIAGSFSSEPGTWATKKDAREVCPKGYRIPDDGPTDQSRPGNTRLTPPVEESEGAQSLFLNPPVDNQNEMSNSVKGYYADGFFDRRPLESYTDKHNVVSRTDHRIAHLGVVMFNPWNYGSLFFPLSGTRGNGASPGGSGQTGQYAFTQTIGEGMTTSSTTLSFYFVEALNMYYVSRSSVNAGVSITVRCVPEK
ncbi:MAG: FimB/Mfa2 family fimbrial subunit [Alistipes sp.]|nr:FimB/Mfa2 family fimbrial subunit [Alistipes sp.]